MMGTGDHISVAGELIGGIGPQMEENNGKTVLLNRLAPQGWVWHRLSSYGVDGLKLHVRWCSTYPKRPAHYKFNINARTLSADFEIWICGSPDMYYILPVSEISKMYGHPSAYHDYRHPLLRVVTVNTTDHSATYARGGTSINLREYLLAKLPSR
jgi:hypothetical protein